MRNHRLYFRPARCGLFFLQGQAVSFHGSVSNGMGFDVTVDGTTTTGAPTGSTLASISGLAQGNHTVTLTAKSSGQNPDSLFTLNHAIVTVGTGLTGYPSRSMFCTISCSMEHVNNQRQCQTGHVPRQRPDVHIYANPKCNDDPVLHRLAHPE